MLGASVKSSLLAAAALLQFLTPASAAAVAARDSDPFYTPPYNWQSAKPGAILKSRQVYNSPFVQYASANLKSTWQFLLRSNDQDNNPVPLVTTLLVPQNPANGKNERLLTYLSPYDTAYNLASPSYYFYNNTINGTEGITLSWAVNKGWFVNVPDYESTLAGFGNGPLSGKGVLDSIRGSLNSGAYPNVNTGLSTAAWVAVYGASGGALAGEWAAELQADYAGDLAFNIVGYALGALTPFINNVYNKVNGGLPAGLIVSVVLGVQNTVKSFRDWLAYGLVPATADEFRSALYLDANKTALKFVGKNISNYFNQGSNWLNDKVPQQVLNQVGIMGKNYQKPPGVPMYFYKGSNDGVSDLADTQYLYNLYCAGNIRSLTLNISTQLAHVQSGYFGLPGAAKFIQDRFNGVPAPQGCTQVSNNKPTSYEAWDAQWVNQNYLDALYQEWKSSPINFF